MTTKADNSDSDVWLEEGDIGQENQGARRRRPNGSENEVERLVQSISSDDLWVDDDTHDENSNGKKSWKRTSGKTYHDPTVDTISETESSKWNYYEGESSEAEEVTTSGKVTASTNESDVPNTSPESLEEATSIPIMILRYFRSNKAENKNDDNSEEIVNQDPSTSQDRDLTDDDQSSTLQYEVQKNDQTQIDDDNNNEENKTDGNENQPYFSRLADKLFRRESKKKESPNTDVAKDQPKFCPMCGQSLDGIHFQEGSIAADKPLLDGTDTFEGRLTNAKMWRAVWVSLEDAQEGRSGNKLYRSEIHVDLEGNKTLSEGVSMGEKIELAKFISS